MSLDALLDTFVKKKAVDPRKPRLVIASGNEESLVLNNSLNQYPDNTIINTKYTMWTFIPKNLMEQFKRAMNRYFLIIACLQLEKTITPVNPISTFGPLAIIFMISAVKEFVDDLGRAAQDKIANERKYKVIRKNPVTQERKTVDVCSKDIRVGDIVVLGDQEEVPCDLCILKSSIPNGICFLQTTNLDGETNLKSRQAVPETQSLSLGEIESFSGAVMCAQPNNSVYKFDSRLWIRRVTPEELKSNNAERVLHADEAISISGTQLLQQTATVKNIDFVYGLAVYTGNETKFSKNKDKPPLKWTKADAFINKIAVYVFIFQLVLVLVFGIIGVSYEQKTAKGIWYLRFDVSTDSWLSYVTIPLRFLLLNSTMIPISLKVTLDVSKMLYAKFINWDRNLYEPELGHEPARANNSAISEDLGQIEYVLSDKTGTLTQNLMEFRFAAIDDEAFVLLDSEAELKSRERDIMPVNLYAEIHKKKTKKVIDLVMNMVLNNGVQPTKSEGKLIYKSSSPDEEALVKACAEIGVRFVSREGPNITIDYCGEIQKYLLLQELEFTSDRKRMSVVIRDLQSGKVKLLVKGADDMIISKLAKNQDPKDMNGRLDEFAQQGLRTLVYGYRDLRDEEFIEWMDMFQKAKTQIENREDAVAKVCDLLEHSFILTGATAIEDKLQDKVSETITALRYAGIRFWMLTGDKFDTAVQIATACAMRKPNGLLVEITANDIEEMHSNLKVCQLKCKRYSTGESGDGYFDSNDVCLVIRGDRLDLALDDYNKKDFIKLIISAKSVVCCRFTPLQKAQIVGLVKDEGHMTLAIGDGGNDVSMIQKAHIGVGIRGKEGLQAARAADYQINYFRYLKRLLLVHGHYSIRRTGFISEYSYYKSLLFCLFQVMYGFYTGFSGNSIFNGGCITAYNMLLFFPIVSFCLDKDLDHNYLMDHPYAYTHTALGHDFNWRTFSRWIIRAVIQGLVIFFCSIAAFSSNYSATSGYAVDYDVLGYVVFFAYLWTQSITLVIELKYIAKINITAIWGFHFLALLIMFASSLVRSFDSLSPYYAGYVSLLDPILWLTNVLVTVFAIFPVILEKYVSFNYSPTIIQKLYAASILKKYDLPSSTIQQAVTPEADTL